MTLSFNRLNCVMRKSFVERNDEQFIPQLMALQKESYESFLQLDNDKKRISEGLQKVFESFFPLTDNNKRITLDFVKYRTGEPKYSYKECLVSGRTYSVPIYATLRLILWSDTVDNAKKEIKVIKEQEVFLCDLPLMTENASFIINGAERVVVSQMRRAPGIFFDSEDQKATNAKIYKAKIVPQVGAWLDFEFDAKDLLYFKIDKKRKIPVTTLLRALELDVEDIIKTFYKEFTITLVKDKWIVDFDYEKVLGRRFDYDIVNADNDEVVIKKSTKITKRLLEKLKESGFKRYYLNATMAVHYLSAENISDQKTGEILLSAGVELSEEKLDALKDMNVKKINVVNTELSDIGPFLFKTLQIDKNDSYESALFDIFKAVRVGENVSSLEQAEKLFTSLFFTSRYNLSPVGRMKMNYRLGISVPQETLHLTKDDLIATIRVLCKIKNNDEKTDDIDNLTNRRLKAVGELIETQFASGMARIERSILEKLNTAEIESIMPQSLINAKPLISSINDFFATSQLSQFMDQTNPLSEIAHKRRLSALGPGGLTRERAGFEVRDVHPTHYGRICPIETPEGQNIGLINNLAIYARVNKFGFIETPYRKVVDGIITDEVVYLSALEEIGCTIAQANLNVDKNNKIVDEFISCRKDGEYIMATPDKVDYADVSPKQVVSVATTLIPFLENDDAKRALMGSNMMRQAVPLMKPEAPLVGTGIESVAAKDCSAVVLAKKAGVVKSVDSSKIIIETPVDDELPEETVYELDKYKRTNNDTTINQKPVVVLGQKVVEGEMIASGQSIEGGELAVGKNALIAFMTWDGYNFEDSVIISERLVRDDAFTSIHIEEFEIVARDTRLGPEEITRDIPNVGEDVLRKLDETGIIYIGAEVKAGDILVGKTTPKSESPTTPEEKLLKLIFGEKVSDVKDSSLYVPPGVLNGTVIDVKVFTRQGLEKDERMQFIETSEIERLSKKKDEVIALLRESLISEISNLIVDKKVEKNIEHLKKGDKITRADIKLIPDKALQKIVVDNDFVMEEIERLNKAFKKKSDELEKEFTKEVLKMKEGDDLAHGVLKVVKVLIASKQRLQPGDKMSGRHGNKGVISRILPMEDMPFLDDGTPVDILLSPLGIPSRMNIGQILETHLGWASVGLGKQIGKMLEEAYENKEKIKELRNKLLKIYDLKKENEKIKAMNDDEIVEFAQTLKRGVPFATGVFEKIEIKTIENIMEEAGLDKSGQIKLVDGRTGQYFDRPITVGYMYMLKLHHLVDSKIHARSIGPYSLITQQPLAGKAHFGGQRFGEMECWALQAYGAAYTLQEMLTVKSDDVMGRIKIYDSIIQGTQNFDCGIPESFNVMLKEVRSLGLNVELIKKQ